MLYYHFSAEWRDVGHVEIWLVRRVQMNTLCVRRYKPHIFPASDLDSPAPSLWQVGSSLTAITVRQNESAGGQETVVRLAFLGEAFHSTLPQSVWGEQPRLDAGWRTGEETLMDPDKACRLPVWWARLRADDLITFHPPIIGRLLNRGKKMLPDSDLMSFWNPVAWEQEKSQQGLTLTRPDCCVSMTLQSCEAVLVSGRRRQRRLSESESNRLSQDRQSVIKLTVQLSDAFFWAYFISHCLQTETKGTS